MNKWLIGLLIPVHMMAFDMGDNLLKDTKAGWRGMFTGISCPNESECSSVWVYRNKADEGWFFKDNETSVSNVNKKDFNKLNLESEINNSPSKETQKLVKKITAGLNSENSSTLRADIYTGSVGNVGMLVHLKSTMTQDSKATDDEVASDYLLDYNGGSFNVRLDLQDWVKKIYKADKDGNLTNGDAYGYSWQLGIKGQSLTSVVGTETADNVEYIPYTGIVGQWDFGIYNKDNPDLRDGILQLGLHISYEYLNDDIKDIMNNDVENHEGIVGAYANFVIDKVATISTSYSTVVSHFQDRKRFFISLNIYPDQK